MLKQPNRSVYYWDSYGELRKGVKVWKSRLYSLSLLDCHSDLQELPLWIALELMFTWLLYWKQCARKLQWELKKKRQFQWKFLKRTKDTDSALRSVYKLRELCIQIIIKIHNKWDRGTAADVLGMEGTATFPNLLQGRCRKFNSCLEEPEKGPLPTVQEWSKNLQVEQLRVC